MCPGGWVSQDFYTIDIWNEGGKFYSFILEAESNPRRLVRPEKLNDPFRGSNPRPSVLYALPQPTTVYRWCDYQLDCSGWPSNTWYWWRGIDCVYVRSQDSGEWPLTFSFFIRVIQHCTLTCVYLNTFKYNFGTMFSEQLLYQYTYSNQGF